VLEEIFMSQEIKESNRLRESIESNERITPAHRLIGRNRSEVE